MKAARLYGHEEPIRIEDIPIPELKPNHAIIKVKAAGVCGSELDFIEGIFPYTPPFVLGHEVAGVIDKIDQNDANPAGLKVGDKVAVYNMMGCGSCEYCRSDKENMCPHNSGQIGFTVDGGFEEYVQVPIYNLVPMPEKLSFAEAAILTCSGLTAVHSTRRAGTKFGDTVVVNGIGGVGLMCIQVAKILGAKVIAVGNSDEKCELAKSMGADLAINTMDYSTLGAKIYELTNGHGADVYYDLVGTTQTYDGGVDSLGYAGRLMIIGYRKDNPVVVEPVKMLVKEIQIMTSVAGCKIDVELALKYAAEGKLKVAIDKRMKLDQINEAIELLMKNQVSGRNVIIMD